MNSKSIIISIYPKYIKKIIAGEKNFEFRSFNLENDGCNFFWVYETSPVKALKYRLTVKDPIQSLDVDQHYFLGDLKFQSLINEGKYGYEIIHLDELIQPIELKDLKKMGVAAPQGYAYTKKYLNLTKFLDRSELKRIF